MASSSSKNKMQGAAVLALSNTSLQCSRSTLGVTRSCYTGPSTVRGVGQCVGGTQQCEQHSTNGAFAWSACVGSVLPAAVENCSATTVDADYDCNGYIASDDPACIGSLLLETDSTSGAGSHSLAWLIILLLVLALLLLAGLAVAAYIKRKRAQASDHNDQHIKKQVA